MGDVSEIIAVINRRLASDRKFFRENKELRDLILETLPVDFDWPPTMVAEFIRQHSFSGKRFSVGVGGREIAFRHMTKAHQASVCRSILDRLVREGLVSRALGMSIVSGREAVTYNGVDVKSV